MKVPIGISARHTHLTKEHLEILFGRDYCLKILKKLSQPGEYASLETIGVKGPKGKIEKIRVLGPIRKYTQIEISKTDAYKLGLTPPVRESGDIVGSSPITLVGPKGQIELSEGCIIASRHIHITPDEVKKLGLENQTKVCVLIDGVKGGIIHNVTLKVSENYQFELHLDTDDGNAFLINQGDMGTIIKY
ncbi:MAG: phosphate propanoyltransferase [Bacilli bacterium]|nr:phosphate propanoyltransferase [Bacilli bacterium]MDD4282416.1 phosphate propanoyltransferase [Bacilli bacterium]